MYKSHPSDCQKACKSGTFSVLTDNKTLFIENFNRSVYQPDLLFDDDEIIARICEHPQAIWRTKVKFND